MLLRSSSTPVLNSWQPNSNYSSSEPEILYQIPKICSISLSASSSCSLSSIDDLTKKMTRALSESDLRDMSLPKKRPFNKIFNGLSIEEEKDGYKLGFGYLGKGSFEFSVGLLSNTGLDEGYEVGIRDSGLATVLVGDGVGGTGGKIGDGGGGGSDGGNDGSSELWDSNSGSDKTDIYYQKMIDASPGNSLFLSNYAKFLKDVSFLTLFVFGNVCILLFLFFAC